ncbi:MAG: methionyl-tRNA formyltransferase [Burkholderiaceae bacterium]|nr:methionyl-tRNA formyltransferase [Burkholderiaceae bacterium]
MRVIFAGTPEFAAASLQALLSAGFDVPLVLTQPDRPAGRGLKLQASAVKTLALAHGIDVAQPAGLKLDGRFAEEAQAARTRIEQARADVMVVAAYGLILPQWVLDMPRMGCVNVHASLLPRWRGAAPIHRAIQAGDTCTGVTIMQMDAGLDTGDMLLVDQLPIEPDDTTAALHDKLAVMGGRLLVEALELAACGGSTRTPQPEAGVTYAHKIEKSEAPLDWRQPADALLRQVLAFNPFPGATCRMPATPGQAAAEPEVVKVWAAALSPDEVVGLARDASVGQVLGAGPNGVDVCCGAHSALRLTVLQRAGGKRLSAAQWLGGTHVPVGQQWLLPEPVQASV